MSSISNTITRKQQRQLEILSKYCQIDLIKKIVIIPFTFNKASDLFEPTIGHNKRLCLKDEIMQQLSNVAQKIPDGFKIDVKLKIDNYEKYTPKEVADAIKNGFELFHYEYRSAKTKDRAKFAIFAIVGIILFGIWALVSIYNLLSQSTAVGKTILEILYTIPCVLFWEAIYVIFWPDNSLNNIKYSILYQLDSLSMIDSSKKVVYMMSKKEFFDGWIDFSKKRTFFRLSFMIIATLIVAFVVLDLIASIDIHHVVTLDKNLWIAVVCGSSINALAGCIAGIVSLSLYLEKGKIRKYSTAFCFILVATGIVNVVLSILLFNELGRRFEIVVFSVLMLFLSIYLLVCNFLLKKTQKISTQGKKPSGILKK